MNEKQNNEIYVVTDGEYSDYHICGMFSNFEKAEEYKDANGLDNPIEVYDLDKPFTRKEQIWKATISSSGNSEAYPICWQEEVEDMVGCFQYYNYPSSNEDLYTFLLRSDGAKKAIKIASEMLFQIKANSYLYPKMKDKDKDGSFPWYNYKTMKIVEQTYRMIRL